MTGVRTRAKADLEALGREVSGRRLHLPHRPRLKRPQPPGRGGPSAPGGHRRRRWLIAAILVVLAGTLGWVVAFSPLLAVANVRANGVDRLTSQQVIDAARVKSGTPLVRVPRGEIERRVEKLPDVLRASVSISFPSTVVIKVVERTASGVLELASGKWALVDETGHQFTTVDAQPAKLPILVPAPAVASDPDTLGAMAQVAVSVPASVRANLVQVSASSPSEVTLLLSDQRTVVWGASDRNADKARVLPALLARPGKIYNVTDPDLPYTRTS
jgi:cell division protein FtsQ